MKYACCDNPHGYSFASDTCVCVVAEAETSGSDMRQSNLRLRLRLRHFDESLNESVSCFHFCVFCSVVQICPYCWSRSLQLCGKHTAAKQGLFGQAGKKGKDMLEALTQMEKSNRDELLDHIKNFCETCPC